MPPSERKKVLVATAYWSEAIFAGIAEAAARFGWILDDTFRWQRELPAGNPGWDGVIAFGHNDAVLIAAIRGLKIPIVDMQDYADHFGAPKIVGDDPGVGRMAAEHLIRCGVASLITLRFDNESAVTGHRRAGFASVAAEAKLEVRTAGMDELVETVRRLPGPVGLFASGDSRAVEAERVLLDAGLRIPEDVAVLGAHDTPLLCEHAPVPLSSVNVNFERKGRAAAELLRSLMGGEPAPRTPVVVGPRSVTARASTRLHVEGDSAFRRLTDAMAARFHENVAVDELCLGAGLSPGEARKLAHERLGRTLVEELTRLRIERAKALLAENRMNLPGIAAACGFGTRQALFNAFKRLEGVSPDQWRDSRSE